jgi:single-stranded-DNA-specific exonuclease
MKKYVLPEIPRTGDLSAYPELLADLLHNRGIRSESAAEKFLNPSYLERPDPFLMKDMERAVVRIFEAIEAKEKIIVYSDYDCDGIPGSVIFHDFFSKIGYKNFEVYIPHRELEGYGLNKGAIKNFYDQGAKLIITVDLGTRNIEEVALAEGYGIDVIVTDHHLPDADLPKAYAVINPKREGDSYPEKDLCGAGLAFRLVEAFLKKYREYFKVGEGWEKWLLDMAGLATLADMVPLTGENRIIAFYGLQVLRKSKRLGLQKIFEQMKISPKNLTEEDLTFSLAPRINAASRLDVPRRAFELLAATDAKEAEDLAQHLSGINQERKNLVTIIFKEANQKLKSREEKEVIVVGNPEWRVGILGLLATRLIEEYERPVFVWGRSGETIKGSCRSDRSVNLVEMMQRTTTLLEFGGHELAGGFSVSQEKIHFLEDDLLAAYEKTKRTMEENIETEFVDKVMSLDDANKANFNLVQKLAPFGQGNPKPLFLFQQAKVVSVKPFGKHGEHLEICFEKPSGGTIKAISFFSKPGDYAGKPEQGKSVDLVAHIEESNFGWRPEIRLRIVDII